MDLFSPSSHSALHSATCLSADTAYTLCLFLWLHSLSSLSRFYPSILPSSSCLFKSRAGGTVPEGISLWNMKSTLLWVYSRSPSPHSDSSTAKQQQQQRRQQSECTAVASRFAACTLQLGPTGAKCHTIAISSHNRKGQEGPDQSEEVSPSSLEVCQSFPPRSLRQMGRMLGASFVHSSSFSVLLFIYFFTVAQLQHSGVGRK